MSKKKSCHKVRTSKLKFGKYASRPLCKVPKWYLRWVLANVDDAAIQTLVKDYMEIAKRDDVALKKKLDRKAFRESPAGRIKAAVAKQKREGGGCVGCRWWSEEDYRAGEGGVEATCENERSRNYGKLMLCGCGWWQATPKREKVCPV